jgi:hypothetical protein
MLPDDQLSEGEDQTLEEIMVLHQNVVDKTSAGIEVISNCVLILFHTFQTDDIEDQSVYI